MSIHDYFRNSQEWGNCRRYCCFYHVVHDKRWRHDKKEREGGRKGGRKGGREGRWRWRGGRDETENWMTSQRLWWCQVFIEWPPIQALRSLVCQVFSRHHNLKSRILQRKSTFRETSTNEKHAVNSKIIFQIIQFIDGPWQRAFQLNLNCEETISPALTWRTLEGCDCQCPVLVALASVQRLYFYWKLLLMEYHSKNGAAGILGTLATYKPDFTFHILEAEVNWRIWFINRDTFGEREREKKIVRLLGAISINSFEKTCALNL